MKEKILEALKTSYKNLGFGEKAFEGVADYLSSTVTDEASIETAISGVESLLKAFQGETDRVRGEKTALQRELDELKKKKTPTRWDSRDKVDGKDDDDAGQGGEIAALAELIKSLTAKVETLSGDRTLETRSNAFEKSLEGLTDKQKQFFISDFKRMSFADDADFTFYLEEKKASVADIVQENANAGLTVSGKPGGGGDTGDVKQASKEETAALLKNMNFLT